MTGETVEVEGRWQKIELTFEEIDVQQLLAQHNIRPDADVTPVQKFRLMELESQKLTTAYLNRNYPQVYPTPAARQRLTDLNQAEQLILSAIAEKNS